MAIDAANEQFQRLDSDAVAATLERLRDRIVARFPQRNLSLVAEQVGLVITRVQTESSERPRQRRRQTLATLHRLRSLTHVIDMHQLTKDPERILSAPPPTDASIEPDLAPDELGRYLDYCSELLSLVSKTAALCSQDAVDPLVLDTVSEIESLTLGMSRKIWQKISLLHGAAVPPM